MRALFFTISLCLLMLGCKKPEEAASNLRFQDGYWICNEGNFTFGNASLTHFNPATGVSISDAYQKVNGAPIGDVLQSVNLIDGKLFLVVNNSGKILVCDPVSLHLEKIITGFVSPRYIAQVNDSVAIVSDLYDKQMPLINLKSLEISGYVDIGATTEDIITGPNELYTLSWSNANSIYKLGNVVLNPTIDSLHVGAFPVSMEQVGNKLWVACQGSDNEDASLVKVDIPTFSVDTHLYFTNKNASAASLDSFKGDSFLYFISNQHLFDANLKGGVFRMHTQTAKIDSLPWIENDFGLFYDMAIDDTRETFVISDAKDYLSPGEVLIYSKEAELEQKVPVGIIPGFVYTN